MDVEWDEFDRKVGPTWQTVLGWPRHYWKSGGIELEFISGVHKQYYITIEKPCATVFPPHGFSVCHPLFVLVLFYYKYGRRSCEAAVFSYVELLSRHFHSCKLELTKALALVTWGITYQPARGTFSAEWLRGVMGPYWLWDEGYYPLLARAPVFSSSSSSSSSASASASHIDCVAIHNALDTLRKRPSPLPPRPLIPTRAALDAAALRAALEALP